MTNTPRRHVLKAMMAAAATGFAGSATATPLGDNRSSHDKLAFLLVHGAWHSATALSGVLQALRLNGHEAEAAVLPGTAPGTAEAGITFNDYVDAVVDAVRQQHGKVVLVGHSSAGMLMQAALPRIHARVERVVFCNAFIVANGQSQLDNIPADAAAALAGLAAQNGGIVPIAPLDGFVRGALMEGDSVAKQDALLQILIDQPFSLISTPVDTTRFDALDVPRSVVFCSRDHSADYLGMTARLGRYDVAIANGSHEMLFSAPKAFAKALLSVSMCERTVR
jgi:pimeloyl-ACP methyl ester carboxylesterase